MIPFRGRVRFIPFIFRFDINLQTCLIFVIALVDFMIYLYGNRKAPNLLLY